LDILRKLRPRNWAWARKELSVGSSEIAEIDLALDRPAGEYLVSAVNPPRGNSYPKLGKHITETQFILALEAPQKVSYYHLHGFLSAFFQKQCFPYDGDISNKLEAMYVF
jgi:hypothetical protein